MRSNQSWNRCTITRMGSCRNPVHDNDLQVDAIACKLQGVSSKPEPHRHEVEAASSPARTVNAINDSAYSIASFQSSCQALVDWCQIPGLNHFVYS
jgi:hypothetical protein